MIWQLKGTIWLFWMLQMRILPSNCLYHIASRDVFELNSPDSSYFGYSIDYNSYYEELEISDPLNSNIYLGDVNTKVLENNEIYVGQKEAWYGATVKTGAYGSSITVSCAPRYLITSQKATFTTGRCFLSTPKGPQRLESINMTYMYNIINDVLDYSGWSIEIDEQETILVGSPDTGNGFVMVYDNSSLTPKVFTDVGKTRSFGYSIASGNFLDNHTSYAIGSPFGDFGEGKVSIFTKEGNLLFVLPRGDVGAMYGATLCSAQLAGNKKSLLIGAPTYTERLIEYDRGAVFVYASDDDKDNMTLKSIIKGTVDRGYFGYAIVSVGDLDGDNIDDIAIGAPHENNGTGAVYVYSGADLFTGKPLPLQRISVEGVQSFGFSLTALIKQNDGCNGLAVGAPFSNNVMTFKCLSTITVTVYAEFPNFQKRADQTQFIFQSCMLIKYPQMSSKTIDAEIDVRIELTHPNAKIKNSGANGQLMYVVSLSSTNSLRHCQDFAVLTPPEGNYDVPIEYKITARETNDPLQEKFDVSKVTLSNKSVLTTQGTILVADCGEDNKCTPIFTANLSSSLPEQYTVGSTRSERFSVSLVNEGEAAYAACVTLRADVPVLRPPPACTRSPDRDLVTCRPLHVLHNGDIWNTGDVEFDLESLTSENEVITIIYDIYNHCEDESDKATFFEDFTLQHDTSGFDIIGTSNPSAVINITSRDIESGKQFEHKYTITNNGSTNWVDVECEILLLKVNFMNYTPEAITVDSSDVACSFEDYSPENLRAVCKIGDLFKNREKLVSVRNQVLPKTMGNEESVDVTTELKLTIGEQHLAQRITTTLMRQSASIPLWIKMVAVFVGLLFLLIIGLVLLWCNCFERKNKKKVLLLQQEMQQGMGVVASEITFCLSLANAIFSIIWATAWVVLQLLWAKVGPPGTQLTALPQEATD